jgi:alpha-galactosidase
MLAAPLIAGNDLRNMSDDTRAILTNKNLIAIDQDPLGRQGYRVSMKEGLEVFVKPLQGGDTAVCLLNRGDQEKQLDFAWKEYGIGSGHSIKDLWKDRQTGTTDTRFRGTLGRHQVIVLRLSN